MRSIVPLQRIRREPKRRCSTVTSDPRLDLMLAPATQAAFDVSREPPAMHDRYGRCEMGQVLLLSRRLIEAGVRFVTTNAVSNPENTKLSAFQIWDTHFDHFRLYDQNLLPELDQRCRALISDLDERGLLQETLVIVMGRWAAHRRSTAALAADVTTGAEPTPCSGREVAFVPAKSSVPRIDTPLKSKTSPRAPTISPPRSTNCWASRTTCCSKTQPTDPIASATARRSGL